MQRFNVHPVYTFYTKSSATVVRCSANLTWRQNGESKNLTNDLIKIPNSNSPTSCLLYKSDCIFRCYCLDTIVYWYITLVIKLQIIRDCSVVLRVMFTKHSFHLEIQQCRPLGKTRSTCNIFAFVRRILTLSRDISLSHHTCFDEETRFTRSYSRRTAPFSNLFRQVRVNEILF